jgi:RNA polymerase sigma-54 factor
MLKQKLSQKMLQKLSPQQIQLMKLLQIPTATLEQRIKEELEANPALDEGADRGETAQDDGPANEEELNKEEDPNYELDDYLEEYMEEDPTSYYDAYSSSSDEENKNVPIAVQGSFHDYLLAQLGMLNIPDERDLTIAKQIIGSIDDDGYLRREPMAILDDLLFTQNIEATEEEVEQLLKRIQKFDPPGVGARDLQECLLIQLKHKLNIKLKDDDPEYDDYLLSLKIIKDYFNEFSKKHFQKLLRNLDITEDELRTAMDIILKLNPKPASGVSSRSDHSNHYIIPDFIIENRDGELVLNLNTRNAPDLKINYQYQNMLRDFKDRSKGQKVGRKDKEAIMFIKQKIDAAKWFIDAIRQRQHTMYKTMYAILQYQYDYFLTGDQRKLKPMILKDIGDITGLDISTVSRVVNSKFVQTEFGTKKLKELFSESLQTQDGEEVSTLEVKNILTDIIENEDKRKPLSDEKLKNILREKGYNIARRTVAKYREQLSIPVARLRKEL